MSFSGSPVCSSIFLTPSANSTMPGDHRQVQQRVGVARELAAARAPSPRRSDARRRPRRRRSTATTARTRSPTASTPARITSALELDGLGADADRDDRLAQRDDHHEPEALGEVARRGRASPRRRGSARSRSRGRAPRPTAGRASCPSNAAAREDDQPGAGDQRDHEREHGLRQRRVPARGEREQRRVQQPHGEIGEPHRRRRRPRTRRASRAPSTSIAAIAANITSRGSTSSGSTVLVSHA